MKGNALYGYACGYPTRLRLLCGAYVGHAYGGSGGACMSGVIAPGTPSGAGSTTGPIFGASGVGATGAGIAGWPIWITSEAGASSESRTRATPGATRVAAMIASFWAA